MPQSLPGCRASEHDGVSGIRIIRQGSLTTEAFESPRPDLIGMKYLSGTGGNSTVTYIESDARILIDTGFERELDLSEENIGRNRNVLIHALKEEGLKPGDIDILFITHWHADHFLNYDLFSGSEIIMAEPALQRHSLDFTGVQDGGKIAKGVEVLFTPGHTADHASLIVSLPRQQYRQRSGHGGMIIGIGAKTVVVAGDAVVSPCYYLSQKMWDYNSDFESMEAARQSFSNICSIADYIIPGHGGMFENVRKGNWGIMKSQISGLL